MAIPADGSAGSATVTQHILDCVHDECGQRYSGIDHEWLETRLRLEVVSRKQVQLVTDSQRIGIDQIGFGHLNRLLRTPEPGSGWPVCASAPGCVAETFLRCCPSSAVTDFVRKLPCARLAAYLSPAEVVAYDENRELPIDAPSRQCLACLLAWQNKCVAQCHVASAIEGLGQTFEQRVSMFAGVDDDGIHADWLMLPGHAPLDKMSGFVAPMPYSATWGYIPRIVRTAVGIPCGVRLDPTPMQHAWAEQVRHRLHLTATDALEALAALAAMPGLQPIIADVALGRLPRDWSSLQAWQAADPTLISEMPWASTCPDTSTPCPHIFQPAVCGTAALVAQRAKEWLSAQPSLNDLALRPWIHYLQAQLIKLAARPETWLGSPWPTGTPSSLSTPGKPVPKKPKLGPPTPPTPRTALPASPTRSLPLPRPTTTTTTTTEPWVMQGMLPPLPDLETALLATCRFLPSDLARRPKTLPSVACQILHHLLVGARSKAARLIALHPITFPLPVLEALLDDRVDNMVRFNTPLRQRMVAGLVPIEPSLTDEQRVYLWLAVASYLGGRIWQMPLRRPWETAMMDAYWAMVDANNTCKSRTIDNTPLLAELASPNTIKLQNRALRNKWEQRPADAYPNTYLTTDLLRWLAESRAAGGHFGLEHQYKGALPVSTFVNEVLVNQQLLSQADGWSRPKVLHHCLTCGYITQDQSREFNKDRRDKTPISGNVGDRVTVDYCRWCYNASGLGNMVVAIPLVGRVIQIGTHAWIMCTRCGQQVSVKNSKFHRFWEVLCMWCEDDHHPSLGLDAQAMLGSLVKAEPTRAGDDIDSDDSDDDSVTGFGGLDDAWDALDSSDEVLDELADSGED